MSHDTDFTMSYIPSPAQTLEEPFSPFGEDCFMYPDNFVPEIKKEPDFDFYGSASCSPCSEFMDRPLPSFFQTFANTLSYPASVVEGGLRSWISQHPEHWSSQEVLDWVYFLADNHNLDASRIRGEAFNNICGSQLCRMSREDFVFRDPDFGAYIFNVLQKMLNDAKFSEPVFDNTTAQDNFPMMTNNSCMNGSLTDISNSICTEDNIKILIGGDLYDIDIKIPIEIPGTDQTDPGYYSESSNSEMDRDSVSDHSEYIDPFSFDTTSYVGQEMKTTTYRCHTGSLSSTCSEFSDDDIEIRAPPKKQSNRGRPAGQASKGNHLWEFIRDTLKDPKFNPTLLKWEDKSEGVFRFVQSEAVAQMWGRKKNNAGMTYEKLSRAMRFCRTTEFFAALPKTGKYPKKLCFKFGRKAFGWQN